MKMSSIVKVQTSQSGTEYHIGFRDKVYTLISHDPAEHEQK